MGISLFFIIGLIGMFFVIILKQPMVQLIGNDQKLVVKLSSISWFQHPLFSGVLLFFLNAILFGITFLTLYGIMKLFIPFLHLIVMMLAVLGSIYLWLVFRQAWGGSKNGRLMMAFIGSSFYLVLTVVFSYLLLTLNPSYPGDDTFMAALGLTMALTVSLVAFLICFVFTGLSKKG